MIVNISVKVLSDQQPFGLLCENNLEAGSLQFSLEHFTPLTFWWCKSLIYGSWIMCWQMMVRAVGPNLPNITLHQQRSKWKLLIIELLWNIFSAATELGFFPLIVLFFCPQIVASISAFISNTHHTHIHSGLHWLKPSARHNYCPVKCQTSKRLKIKVVNIT